MNRLDHATNIENILFCDIFDGSTDIVIKWKLHKYQHHFDIVRITGYQILSHKWQNNGICYSRQTTTRTNMSSFLLDDQTRGDVLEVLLGYQLYW